MPAPQASTRPPNQEMSQQEYINLLQDLLDIYGWTLGQTIQAIGPQPDGRTRSEISDQLSAWLGDR